MKLLSFVLFLLLVWPSHTQARMVSGIDERDSVQVAAPAKSTWDNLKSRVTTWWVQVRGENTQASTSKAKSAEEIQQEKAHEQKVQEAAQQLPVYKVEDKGTKEQEFKSITEQVQKPLTNVVVPERKATADLPLTKSGIPYFPADKLKISVRNIPLLDIGNEEKIQSGNWVVQGVNIPKAHYEAPKKLKSPQRIAASEIDDVIGAALKPLPPLKNAENPALANQKPVTLEMVAKIIPKISPDLEMQLANVNMLTEEEMKYVKAMILYSLKDKCHFASGLFYDLSKSKREDISVPSDFYLGICLHRMGFFSESMERLLNVIESGNKEYVPTAIDTLVSDIPHDYEIQVAKVLVKVTNMTLVPERSVGAFHYAIAKGLSRDHKYEVALKEAEQVVMGHPRYGNAQFIAAVAEYGLGRQRDSIERNKKLMEWIDKTNGDLDLRTLVSLNLGRVAFQSKDYPEASKYYRAIKKDHPLWIQALVEQGWAQLFMGDAAGAIGNMYSIHSPYFAAIFKPESFVVRTIGYLNICQYGDAYKTLSRLEGEYSKMLEKMSAYKKTHTQPADFYKVMVKYLSSKSKDNVDGLPYQVIREMGHHRDYLNVQGAINARIDEGEQYNNIKGVVRKDIEKTKWLRAKAKERQALAEANIKKAATNAAMLANVNQWKQNSRTEADLIEFFSFQLGVFDEGIEGMARLEKRGRQDLEKKRQVLMTSAGDILKNRLKDLDKELVKILDNNEFLRYEVFAGSGENLRFEMAGGTSGAEAKRVPANVKPKSSELNWAFDGEFWEDEIGNYRSSLKNNCK